MEENNYPTFTKTFNGIKFFKAYKEEKNRNNKQTVTLLYLSDITEILKSIITKQNIMVCKKLVQTIRPKQILPILKLPLKSKQQQGVLYETPCLHCDGMYKNVTGRSYATRFKERVM